MENKNIVGYQIHTLDNMIGRQITALFESDGLTKMQTWIIGYLYEHANENIFQKDIEAQFRIARSTATGILKIMEKNDLLTREPVASDARLKRLILTQKGISHQLHVIQNLQLLEERLKQQIDPKDLDVFFQVLYQMQNNMENR